MTEYTKQHKKAWEFDAYEFWVEHAGSPLQRAKEDLEDPVRMLRQYSSYFDTYEGIRVANICGSCGKKAIPLAILGAQVTVFDLSEANCKYALETASAAGVQIDFQVCDIMEINLDKYGEYFDVVFMEGGILHYFHDLDAFMRVMHSLLKDGGRMICSDFHPFTKITDILEFGWCIGDYFSTELIEGEMAHARFYEEELRASIPKCHYRKYTISEIINSVIRCGFTLKRFDEHPAWTNRQMPGEFTVIAER
ncbi:MAG: class I SAM-dependent methyltransferase [Lachnospiraceae bacterium]|jgi:2-polyprenyl-3-methyl-5-hydroxy-6-metoxy-1,4-benzoquinol methylase|nr:class I SAM-dependent methyltransferase [Lachnospiraceae bacterium]MDE6976048.1 class I SAM-dependent methyltransferase [Lachnospiraceae bacterium]